MHQDVSSPAAGSTTHAVGVLEDRRSPFATLRSRIFGSRSDDAQGPKGEMKVGKELSKLPTGWRVLHSLQMDETGSDIDHLVIGPPGIVAVSTKHHPKGKVTVYDRTVYVNGHAAHDHVWTSERSAKRVAATLTSACGFKVPTHGAIVFVDVAEFTEKGRPYGVTVTTRPRLVDWLTSLPAHLHERQIEHIWIEARRPEVWLPT